MFRLLLLHIFVHVILGGHKLIEEYPDWHAKALEQKGSKLMVWQPDAGIGDSLINGVMPHLMTCVTAKKRCAYMIDERHADSQGWIAGLNPKFNWLFTEEISERAKELNQEIEFVERCKSDTDCRSEMYGKPFNADTLARELLLIPSDEVQRLIDENIPSEPFIAVHQRSYSVDEAKNKVPKNSKDFLKDDKDANHFYKYILKNVAKCVKKLSKKTKFNHVYIATDFELFRADLKSKLEKVKKGKHFTVSTMSDSGYHILESVSKDVELEQYYKLWAEWFIFSKAKSYAKAGHYTFFSESVYSLNPIAEKYTCSASPCTGTAWNILWEFYRKPDLGIVAAVKRTHSRSNVQDMSCYPEYIREIMEPKTEL